MSRESKRLHRVAGRAAAKAALLVLAITATVALVAIVGAEGVGRVLLVALPLLPVVLACEGARIALEAAATRRLYASGGAAIPTSHLARAHLVGYAMTTALPAGRVMAEAYKAAAFTRFASRAVAASAGVASQSVALLANAIVSIGCAAVAYARTGFSALTVAVMVHAAIVAGTGLAFQLVSRSERLAAWVSRRSRRLAEPIAAWSAASTARSLVPLDALALHVAARGLQVVGLGVLLAPVAGRLWLSDGPLGQAIACVGTTAGDLVPLQLGATDGAWALAAPLLGLAAADAVAIALLAHAVQITWSAAGALVAAIWRPA